MWVMVLVKANKDSEAGIVPKEKLPAEMGKSKQRAGESRRAACRRRAPPQLERVSASWFSGRRIGP